MHLLVFLYSQYPFGKINSPVHSFTVLLRAQWDILSMQAEPKASILLV